MGSITYFPETGEPVSYDLVASRSIAVRENVPKTLEQIIAETYADPNPFPPLTLEVILVLLSPVLFLLVLILLIFLLRRWFRKKQKKGPRPVRRYLK